MNRRIRVTATCKEEPNIGLYVLALITLAREQQEAEIGRTQPANNPADTPEPPQLPPLGRGEVRHD